MLWAVQPHIDDGFSVTEMQSARLRRKAQKDVKKRVAQVAESSISVRGELPVDCEERVKDRIEGSID